MDAQLKAKWVQALRSGDYQQARGTLKDGDSYCCLGVLCCLTGVAFDEHDAVADETWGGEYHDLLPLSAEEVSQLWPRNDGCRGFNEHSFSEIADYIEANL